MSTSIKIFAAFVFSYLLIACDKPNPGPIETGPPRKPDPSKHVTGQFELKNTVHYNSSNGDRVEYQIISEGEGEVSILGRSEIYLEHRKIVELKDNNQFEGQGNLTIISENNTELRGTYSNIEFLSSGGFTIYVNITGGTGHLANAYGYLVIETMAPPNEVGEFIAVLEGVISLRGQDEFPPIS